MKGSLLKTSFGFMFFFLRIRRNKNVLYSSFTLSRNLNAINFLSYLNSSKSNQLKLFQSESIGLYWFTILIPCVKSTNSAGFIWWTIRFLLLDSINFLDCATVWMTSFLAFPKKQNLYRWRNTNYQIQRNPVNDAHYIWISLRKKCPNTKLFLVRIVLYSDRIRRFTE